MKAAVLKLHFNSPFITCKTNQTEKKALSACNNREVQANQIAENTSSLCYKTDLQQTGEIEQDFPRTMRSMPAAERPFEKAALYGTELLTDAELLAVIINSGAQAKSALMLAYEVLLKCDGITGLAEALPEEFQKIVGIGSKKSIQIKAAVELGQRVQAARSSLQRQKIRCSDDLISMVEPKLRYSEQEQLLALFLDVRNRVIKQKIMSVGGLTSSVIKPRDIFREALKSNAAAVALAHNHPSGDSKPSFADIDSTKKLMATGSMLGVSLLDHIVVGCENSTSMMQAGYIQ